MTSILHIYLTHKMYIKQILDHYFVSATLLIMEQNVVKY